MRTSDEDLMTRYREGDMSAFEPIVLRYRDAIFNFIYHFLKVPLSALFKIWDDVSAPDGFCAALLARAEKMSRQPRRSIFDAVRPLAGPGALVRAAVYGAAVLLLCVAVIFFTELPLRRAPMAEPLPTQTESARQNAGDDDSLGYTTMVEMRVAKIWEYKE